MKFILNIVTRQVGYYYFESQNVFKNGNLIPEHLAFHASMLTIYNSQIKKKIKCKAPVRFQVMKATEQREAIATKQQRTIYSAQIFESGWYNGSHTYTEIDTSNTEILVQTKDRRARQAHHITLKLVRKSLVSVCEHVDKRSAVGQETVPLSGVLLHRIL